ncbi:type III-B CRISPR module RAMP protein Cmr1 [Candidatus Nitrotoga sp. M5]|uniref:type III-B CRISPR module RAMP protein Cmr1 n=1 Tax=Candidatus Nitrotoga sp. M5 TaxID=2890409 RepID=UPI001EF6B2CD|nr:type III-B CRISPR module RAMP protein Cmr1 [Candidatus Nitrotoga sp. M5]CAH1388337.1 CRISPR type III-B/RAMP module RAMP protein Cmr1 [Candidatus Nitrotoga sp. M5]
MPPVTLTAEFKIVTPMFIGGADQSPSDGIRPPSVKGALRFWWRVLNWWKFYKGTEPSIPTEMRQVDALKALHEEEVRLFGGSAEQGGQGVFLLEIAKQPITNSTITDWPTNNTGAGYMAYGILASNGGEAGIPQPHRKGIQEAQNFIMRLRFRPKISQEDQNSILATLNAWNLFGGLGSRSRRGMGSVTRVDPQGNLPTRQEYEQQVNLMIASMTSAPLPPYTAMSSESHFHILSECNNARSVLNLAGQMYKDFRGQGSQLSIRDKIPFGLPLQRVDEKNRRSSPLLFHVHALANNKFVATVLFLPASQFHPVYPSINMTKVAKFAQG